MMYHELEMYYVVDSSAYFSSRMQDDGHHDFNRGVHVELIFPFRVREGVASDRLNDKCLIVLSSGKDQE